MPTIDPRGARFAAALTSVRARRRAAARPEPGRGRCCWRSRRPCSPSAPSRGVQHTPYSWLFRAAVLPRLGPPAEREDAAPPRFAQAVGLGFAVVGLVGFLLGADLLGLVATGFALVAALLNAVFGFCLGCEIYLLIKRLTGPRVVPVGTD